ncbi:hypothetical protein K503DRAFT_49020 [Rhizopogon vinicolor AM-OR11-026]|uniref:Uncharacterized protein n=1 Tax=Rhizopogon vinicolor AM-OR11-026 TaxID=1314800 RepID=A0A1B7MGR8_9AGAM|nr:hypothetical protein K503DRAFT_49020 [Rhizopogon vinicolor AM-OR11-026]
MPSLRLQFMLILKQETLVCMRYDFVISSTAEAIRHPDYHHPNAPLDRTTCQTLYHQRLPVKLLGQHRKPNLPQISTCYPTKPVTAHRSGLSSM